MRRPVVLFLAVALVLAALATPLVRPAGVLDRVETLALVGARRCSEDACPEGPVRPREADPVIVLLFRGPPSQDIRAARGSEFLGKEVPWQEEKDSGEPPS